ncbi:MAG: hypothetical protein CFE44_15925 [Burkholderiales bacterium PBB4]|nr:MAG: hypothetical protein CFE44_15925 [Burkholderiales bacterium PBB4]
MQARGKPRQKVAFSCGFWWYLDPERKSAVRLDPHFWRCGWRVEQLCVLLGVGKRTFGRVVVESLGITTKNWLRQIRIVAACHMIREGWKIKCLANALGIGDEADFTREFKKLIGVSPSYFRKSELSRAEGFTNDL